MRKYLTTVEIKTKDGLTCKPIDISYDRYGCISATINGIDCHLFAKQKSYIIIKRNMVEKIGFVIPQKFLNSKKDFSFEISAQIRDLKDAAEKAAKIDKEEALAVLRVNSRVQIAVFVGGDTGRQRAFYVVPASTQVQNKYKDKSINTYTIVSSVCGNIDNMDFSDYSDYADKCSSRVDGLYGSVYVLSEENFLQINKKYIAEENRAEKEKEAEKNDRESGFFLQAKQTGKPVLMKTLTVECLDGSCYNDDIYICYARRQHNTTANT